MPHSVIADLDEISFRDPYYSGDGMDVSHLADGRVVFHAMAGNSETSQTVLSPKEVEMLRDFLEKVSL